MSVKKYPLVAMASQFARDIVKGKRPASLYVIQACQRHLDDVAASKRREFPYLFDAKAAEKKLRAAELLPHTKGKWAQQRLRVKLEPWQAFGLACTFGWKRKKDGLRRFRESYWEVPRKNGKSVIGAAVALGMFVADGEFGAEVYSGATTEKQAWEVFRPARLMAQRSPAMIEHYGIEVNAASLTRPEDGSRFEPIVGNPGDGASPSCAIVDEYHEHETAALYETMLTGMGAREQPLMFVITTAGANIEGPCYDMRQRVVEMLAGLVPDDQLFGWIWTIDEGDDWKDPKVLAKANPNLGVSVNTDYLLNLQQRAISRARFTNTFKTKHLNVWTTAKEAYFNMAAWDKAKDTSLRLEDFQGWSSVLGFDLARSLDMNSMGRLFWEEVDGKRHYYSVAPKFWVPEDTVRDTDNRRMAERFTAWVTAKHLTETYGAEVDYREILVAAKAAHAVNPVKWCPIDPFGATALAHSLDDEGMQPVIITQNYTNMSDPMKEMEAAIIAGRFHHDGNPIMSWCVGNVIGKHLAGNDDIVRPVKQGNDNKIDGAVALIMGVGRAMLADTGGSVLDSLTDDDILMM
jgi:phage terminase large subunit-like protein